jgi:hypothetical protein
MLYLVYERRRRRAIPSLRNSLSLRLQQMYRSHNRLGLILPPKPLQMGINRITAMKRLT